MQALGSRRVRRPARAALRRVVRCGVRREAGRVWFGVVRKVEGTTVTLYSLVEMEVKIAEL